MTITGSCHCGQTTFRIDGDIPATLTRCTCSFCAKRGALLAYFQPGQFHPTSAAGGDAVYRWNTKLVAHHFCSNCGCATFSDSPAFETDGSWDGSTRRIGVNARLFDDFDAVGAPLVVICLDTWDHVPVRSWPLFKARHVLRTLFANDNPLPIS